MSTQLRLIDSTDGPGDERSWRLDEATKMIGRQGIAAARAALRQSHPRDVGPKAA